MRAIFLNQSGEARIPWRILAMFALIFAAAFAISTAWESAGLPNQRNSSEWQISSCLLRPACWINVT